MKIFNTSGRTRTDTHDYVEANFDIHFQNPDKDIDVLKQEFESVMEDMGYEEMFDDFDQQDLIEFFQGAYLAELERLELERSIGKFPSKPFIPL